MNLKKIALSVAAPLLAVVGAASVAVVLWCISALRILRTVGIPGPIDIGFGIP